MLVSVNNRVPSSPSRRIEVDRVFLKRDTLIYIADGRPNLAAQGKRADDGVELNV
jgi:hypothetical protein